MTKMSIFCPALITPCKCSDVKSLLLLLNYRLLYRHTENVCISNYLHLSICVMHRNNQPAVPAVIFTQRSRTCIIIVPPASYWKHLLYTWISRTLHPSLHKAAARANILVSPMNMKRSYKVAR